MMTVVELSLLSALAAAASVPSLALQSPQADVCAEWRECRDLALSAAARRDYETFHDLAWRTIQTGPRNDPGLMYLLARAQSLSGRPHDALVMLQRLNALGLATDAATNEDFSRTRELPDWPEVETRIFALIRRAAPESAAGTAAAVSPPAVSPPSASASPASAVASRTAIVTSLPVGTSVRFSAEPFTVGGLAYDSLSRRFVLGDRLGRKLIVLDERSKQTNDLIRGDSAGFLEIAAVEIDAKRGDLWVASSGVADGAGTLHKLQLVSGRPLRAFRIAPDLAPVKLVDLAVSPTGTVFVLDTGAPQLVVLRPGETSVESVIRIEAQDPVSVALGRDDGSVFVAHRRGVSRIDLRSRTVSAVAGPKGASIEGLERIRRHGTSLIAVQVEGDGSRRVVRLEMNARENAITRITELGTASGQTFVATISGDELIYLSGAPGSGSGSSDPGDSAGQRDFVASRASLR